MSSEPRLLDNWTHAQTALLNRGNLVAGHKLHQLDLFSDQGLIQTLASHPRSALGVNTMGDDPANRGDWREGSAGELDAATMLQAVKDGRLWLNLRRVMDFHPEYDHLVNQLYDELEQISPGLNTFNRSANLLISSPTALVYYHMDCPVNMLWHIRGEKRVWVYPLETGVLPDSTIESVLIGDSAEEVEYRAELDEIAEVYDVQPGQMITWPQHTPHRVVNTSGLNISLSTEHMTRRAVRKNNVYLANRHFRDLLGGTFHSTRLDGFGAAAKEAALRVCRRLPGLAPNPPQGYEYPVSFEIDPASPNGYRLLDGTDHEAPIIVPMPSLAEVESLAPVN
ncbi:hypothetical protein Pla123a_30030 [Posidoniimonas polymericola]|uniref:JmjC domain-containing protein n=1 Tax=Posidoniimonas polymericola TaxID=2528002 RepID=A0A5C5YKS8_9BACT|nr:hypothetical protein [Posidoniimonas polymericola]TWT75494.1 hypothetical protein Pla123a_30030 [Posidoniimonas polymericola]